jgi:two-component system, chemotaxis family, response regulator WspR
MNDRIRVLVVDDQPITIEAVRRILASDPSISCHATTDYEQALRFAIALRPTVILQDLIMDDYDGLDLVRAYRAEPTLEAIPVVVLSANEEGQTKVEAFAAGANDYVVKLPSALELIARVRYHSEAYLSALERREAFAALETQRALLQEQAHKLNIANQELAESAFTDPLTGLRNRRYYRHYTQTTLLPWLQGVKPISDPRRAGDELSLFLMDVDHFKQINDRFGHDGGDQVLIEIANRLRAIARAGDPVIRWGGEEFLIIAQGTPREHGTHVAQRILNAIGGAALELSSGARLDLRVSIGWVPFPFDLKDAKRVVLERVLNLADAAVYLSKNSGRNRAIGVIPTPHWRDSLFDECANAPLSLRANANGQVQLVENLGPPVEAS